jgi:hypothetical protein
MGAIMANIPPITKQQIIDAAVSYSTPDSIITMAELARKMNINPLQIRNRFVNSSTFIKIVIEAMNKPPKKKKSNELTRLTRCGLHLRPGINFFSRCLHGKNCYWGRNDLCELAGRT